jgi:hypothetical protein
MVKEIQKSEEFQDSSGHNLTWCVAHETNPVLTTSVQASVVFLGMSLCLGHLGKARQYMSRYESDDRAKRALESAIARGGF